MTHEQAFEMQIQFAPSLEPSSAKRFGLNERSALARGDALLDPRRRQGLCEVAESLFRDREEYREWAVDWQPFNLTRLWDELCVGTWRFQEVFDADSRCYGVIKQVEPSGPELALERCRRILGRLLLGESHKVVAIEMGVSLSTVATAAQAGLRSMGLQCRGSRAPLLLAMTACAALYPRPVPVWACSTRIGAEEENSLLLSMNRPDAHLPAQLSPAEAAVVRHLVCGATHAEIARRRGTSCRTVANQLATSFRKLGVSGRAALTAHLILVSSQFRSGDSTGCLTHTKRNELGGYWGCGIGANGFSQSGAAGARSCVDGACGLSLPPASGT